MTVANCHLFIEVGAVCNVFNKDMSVVLDNIADRLEVGVPFFKDVGGDVEGDGELGAWVLCFAFDAEVVVVVLEARQGGLNFFKLSLP